MGSGRLGFVPVRSGDDLVGGAEMLVTELADGLARRGFAVDLLTGTTRDHFTEVDHYPPGVTVRDSGARLVRFRSVASTARADRVRGNRLLATTGTLGADAAARWFRDDVRVPGLVEHLAAHSLEYRALVFAPYLYWTTLVGTLVDPARTIVMPCLHDEPAAGLPGYDRMFRESRGAWFLTEPEAALAARRFDLGDAAVIGSAVAPATGADPARFRARFGVDGPFALTVGRREDGKGFGAFLTEYASATSGVRTPLRLVTVGPGAVSVPESVRDRVLDLGVLDAADRDDALAAATVLVQPSPHESFSRVVMEAWCAGTPVIVNGECAVSVWHCDRSGGGVTYRSAPELAEALRVATTSEFAARGARGRAYAAREASWPTVLDRVEASLDAWLPPGGAAGPADPGASGRRTVVVGPFPPTTGPQVEHVLAATRAGWRAGARVTVVSPGPSLAPVHARPDTAVGARRIGRLLRGADRAVVVGAVHPRLARALDRVAEVERHEPQAPSPTQPRAGLAERVARVRAGGPTFVRTVLARLRPGQGR